MRKILPFLVLFSVSVCFGQDLPTADTSSSTTPASDTTAYDITAIEQQPGYPGGQEGLVKYLRANLKYPSSAKELKVQGKVYVIFVIEKNGEISSVELMKGIKAVIPDSLNGMKVTEKDKPYFEKAAKTLNDEALRVITEMPKWAPGYQNGKAVRCKFIIPITYKLQ